MDQLITSGLPIYCSDKGELMFRHEINCEESIRKYAHEMKGILMEPQSRPDDEPYYDIYRGVMRPGDATVYKEKHKRYDITAIMENHTGGECKKTTGHFHAYVPGTGVSYPEIYEVLRGTAMYILVRIKNHTVPAEEIEVEDVMLVTVEAGETIIIPPNYGHAAINIGDGPMVFDNICTTENQSDYSIVKHYHGMPYYITKSQGVIIPERNLNWRMNVPKPRRMRVKENAGLGIIFHNPVYNEFLRQPDTFGFLEKPMRYADQIMGMLYEQEQEGRK